MSEQVILAIDTATSCSSVALASGGRFHGKVLGSLELDTKVTHSRRLLSSIEYLLKETELGWPDIAGVAVSLGPGSFTGLRIGMATAKGLVMAA
ncbi:MAG TPA: tRNA (adenosine(37)-N6)-threonylcarbamoyltransferase complex dimerization subunit type 1 TsaB, partial [Desulfobacterales bacterium]|nr:tRNA (adenosine(37)-N6)-threonylcarbamoyltransferase complex dimerization subunit type 1 TsaB [Desulfobacterales bacterium]